MAVGQSRPATVPGDPRDRLESWKEIAAYLRRDVTTAQRWEKYEGLPVHRLQHQKLGSVYALKSEIDAWRERARPKRRSALRVSQWAIAALAAAALLMLATVRRDAIFRSTAPRSSGPTADPRSDAGTGEARPLTTDYGDEAEPAMSPDGNFVAFVANGAGSHDRYDLFVKQIAGGDPVRVATCEPSEDCYSPAWSPDGQQLVFLRRAPGEPVDGRAEIVLVHILGGPERRVGTALASGGGLSWFPDGHTIAFSWQDKDSTPARIAVLSVATGEIQSFSSPPAGWFDSHPAVSPDGKAVAFLRQRLDWPYPDLLTQAQPGSTPTTLDFAHREISDIGWLPDSRELLVSSGGALLRLRADGGQPVRVPVNARVGRISVSRSINRVALVDTATEQDIWRVSGPAAASPTAPERAALSSTRDDMRPAYSPDGRRIAFVTKRSGRSEIWTCAADGTACGPVPVPLVFEGQDRPAWSPDGRRLLFEAALPGRQLASIYVFDFLTRTMRALSACPANSRNAVWAPDGATIYFSPDEALQSGVWTAPVDRDGAARQVLSERNVIPVAVEGGYLYLAEFRGPATQRLTATMSRLSLSTGRRERLPGSAWGRYAVWNGKIILIEQHDDGAQSSLVLVDPVARSRKVIADLGSLASQPTVSPDGKWVLFTRVSPNRDLLLITLSR